MIEALQDPIFKNSEIIKHGFFTRQGGVSTGLYASLNCSYTSGDSLRHVMENRRRAVSHLGYSLESLISIKNVHENKVVIVDKPWAQHEQPKADGMVTKLKGLVLGSDSADCPIVLFADENAEVIGWAHAGWRSAKLGIIEETIKQMVSIGASIHNISAVIGPSIAQNSYEVGPEFYQSFLDDDINNLTYFKPSNKQNHFLFALSDFVKNRLKTFNLKTVSTINVNTYEDENRFFSYRRSRHREETNCGGHFSCIGLK